jgi:hypothetical protein
MLQMRSLLPRRPPDEGCRQDRQVECIYREASGGLEGSEIMQFARENSTPCPLFGESGSGPSSDGCSTLSQAPTWIGAS